MSEVNEGAGFLLHYKEYFILGIRIKKPEDVAKDPTVEVEYMRGKVEPADGDNPLKTAFNELLEEVGTQVLEDGWEKRVVPIPTYQPFSKKWIRCALLHLTDSEYAHLVKCDSVHDEWLLGQTRNFTSITGRPEHARKAVSAFVQVKCVDLIAYMNGFKSVPISKNRMNDAKEYRHTAIPMKVTRISNGVVSRHPLRAFNTVIFEQHIENIERQIVKRGC